MLTTLVFNGEHKYLYHIFTHIDAPILSTVKIRFFNPAIFDLSQIASFIGHTETFEDLQHAHMHFCNYLLNISLSSREGVMGRRTLLLSVKCNSSIWHFQYLTQSHQLPLPNFYLEECLSSVLWLDSMLNPKWFDLLQLFPAVENLCISEDLALCLALVLEELTEDWVMEVLPVL
jgi:hypothetical protein